MISLSLFPFSYLYLTRLCFPKVLLILVWFTILSYVRSYLHLLVADLIYPHPCFILVAAYPRYLRFIPHSTEYQFIDISTGRSLHLPRCIGLSSVWSDDLSDFLVRLVTTQCLVSDRHLYESSPHDLSRNVVSLFLVRFYSFHVNFVIRKLDRFRLNGEWLLTRTGENIMCTQTIFSISSKYCA